MEDHLPDGISLAVYADDTILYYCLTSKQGLEDANKLMQDAVDALTRWGNEWRIKFEPSKSQAMTVSRKSVNSTWKFSPISFDGNIVPEDMEINLLGITIDSRLTYKTHVQRVATKGKQRLGMLRKASRVLDQIGRATVYKSFVRPVLEYSPLSWMGASKSNLAKLDRVQQSAARIVGPNCVFQSLHHRRMVAGLSYLYKL